MSRLIALVLVLGISSLGALRTARACGGGFGNGLEIDPSQKIVVVHKNGQETYVFRPHFCGKAAEFGLILPVPAKLAANPALAENKLFDELEEVSAPKIVRQPYCAGTRGGADMGASWSRETGAPQVTVINRGQVGIFEWVLLQADATRAFTDWLDANKFPYASSSIEHFAYYVGKGWYFIAFRVSADTTAPAPGTQLCGDLGPISLSFPAAAPVVPARIAAAAETQTTWRFGWRVFAIAAKQQRRVSSEGYEQLRFSGSLTEQDLTSHPQIAKLAAAGDRLTKLDIEFWSNAITADITLGDAPNQADFRQTIVEHYVVSCDAGVVKSEQGVPILDDRGQPIPARPNEPASDDGGCSIGGLPAGASALGLALALLALGLVLRRR